MADALVLIITRAPWGAVNVGSVNSSCGYTTPCLSVHVAKSAEYTAAGARALVRAREYQRSSRRKMWIILGMLFGVIVIVALIVLAGFMP
jgi:hypothetical protein